MSSTGNPRNKVALLPGHSLMDWIRLGNSGRDLTSVGGIPRDVTESELAEHSTEANAWIVIRGKVYNVAPYLKFHPGGVEELMKGAGIDATKLFTDVHPWVNYESILSKCLVGRFVPSRAATQDDLAEAFFKLPTTSKPKIKMCWSQTTQTVNFRFVVTEMQPRLFVYLSQENRLRILIRAYQRTHIFSFKLADKVEWPCRISFNQDSGKMDLQFTKVEEVCWEKYGVNEADHDTSTEKETEMDAFHQGQLVAVDDVASKLVKLFVVKFVEQILVWIPIGHDIRFRAVINGAEIIRPYTPVPIALPFSTTISQKTFPSCCLNFIVKHYENGAFTPYLFSKSVGDLMDMGIMSGDFDIRDLNGVEQLYLIAGGTGITPMFRLIVWALSCKRHVKLISLLYCCRSEKEIIWKRDLDNLTIKESMFKVQYVVSQSSSSSRLNEHLLRSFLPSPSEDQIMPSLYYVVSCGPTGFSAFCKRYLEDNGYSAKDFYCFKG